MYESPVIFSKQTQNVKIVSFGLPEHWSIFRLPTAFTREKKNSVRKTLNKFVPKLVSALCALRVEWSPSEWSLRRMYVCSPCGHKVYNVYITKVLYLNTFNHSWRFILCLVTKVTEINYMWNFNTTLEENSWIIMKSVNVSFYTCPKIALHFNV